jgi:hypothetical protein
MRRSLDSWLRRWGLLKKASRAPKRRRLAHQECEDRRMMAAMLMVHDVSIQEADTPANAVLMVTLAEAPAENREVIYATEGLNSAQAGADYTQLEGTLTFTPEVTALPVTVSIAGDLLNEGDEKFMLRVGHAEDAMHHHDVTILDNDPLPTVSIGDAAAVTEGRSATASAVFTLELSQPSGRPITVNYRAVSDSAQAGEDFQPAVGAVVIRPGETQKNVTVSVNGDVRQEAQEQFFLDVTSVSDALLDIESSRGAATIQAEDFQFLVTGAGPGGGPHVCVVDPITQELRFNFYAYHAEFTGGVRVATADVNADGAPDIITAAGPGGGPHVKVFSGKTGAQLEGAIGNFYAYDSALPAAFTLPRATSTWTAMPIS